LQLPPTSSTLLLLLPPSCFSYCSADLSLRQTVETAWLPATAAASLLPVVVLANVRLLLLLLWLKLQLPR
jgi:hypothetical protein